MAHNAGFDKGFVAQVMPECADLTWGCSCRGIPMEGATSPWTQPSSRYWPSIFSSSAAPAHRAMGDVETTLALLKT